MGISISSSSGSALFESGPGIPVPSSPGIASCTPPSASPGPPKVGESAENYPRVVVVLDPNRRVIECSAGIQWVLQNRRGNRWDGMSFCRTKEALLHLTGSNHPALTSLPDQFPE
jgi:hypothetical protein